MILKRPTNDGNFSPGGSSNVKCWNIVVKNRNSSILAKASPRHALLPEIKSVLYLLPVDWTKYGKQMERRLLEKCDLNGSVRGRVSSSR